ncbi:MAG: FAD-dependent oxidoreductase [Candidatus Brocadiales bacterium]
MRNSKIHNPKSAIQDRVVILGGGPAGMSAAWRLARAGHKVCLLEREDRVGGLCRTVEYDGFRFDLGGHRFISPDVALVEAVRALMGEELLLVKRRSAVRLMGKEFVYPLEPMDLLRKMDWSCLLACLWDCLTARWQSPHGPEANLEGWLMVRFGPALYHLFFEGYTTKLWGVHPSLLSPDWATARIPLLGLWDVLLRMFSLQKRPSKQFATQFLYPKKGIGQIFEYMEREVRSRGGKVLVGHEVTKILVEGTEVRAVVCQPTSGRGDQPRHACRGQELIEGDRFISTLPLPGLISSLEPPPPDEILSIAQGLQFRGLRFLNLLIDRPAVGVNTWVYVPEDHYIMTRIQEPRLRSPFNVPQGKTSLILEIPCNHGDAMWTMEEGALRDRCLKDLSRLGIEIGAHVLDSLSTRTPQAYPVYRLGYKTHREKTLSFLKRISNLAVCGRGGLFQYLFMDQAMKGGLETAERFLGEGINQKVSTQDEPLHLVEGRSVLG